MASVGVAHLGAAQCLLDNEYKITGIAGTSAGGLFGAVLAAKVDPREICEVVDDFFQTFKLQSQSRFWSSFPDQY